VRGKFGQLCVVDLQGVVGVLVDVDVGVSSDAQGLRRGLPEAADKLSGVHLRVTF